MRSTNIPKCLTPVTLCWELETSMFWNFMSTNILLKILWGLAVHRFLRILAAKTSKNKFNAYLFSTYWEKMIQQFLIQLKMLSSIAIQNEKSSWYNPSAFVSQSAGLWLSSLTVNDALFSSCAGDLVCKRFSEKPLEMGCFLVQGIMIYNSDQFEVKH